MSDAEKTAPKRRWPRLGWWWLALAALLFVLLAAAVRVVPTTDGGRALIATKLEGLKVGRLGWLHVEGIEGDPWRRVTIRRITIRDHTGVWLEARDVAAAWRPEALFAREAHIETLQFGKVTIRNRPVLLPSSPPKPSPISIRLDRVSGRLETLPAFSVNRGLYAVSGHVRVDRTGAPTGAADVLSLLRAGDQLRAKFAFGRHGRFALAVRAREASGGAIGGALGLPPSRDFALDLTANGAGRRGSLDLVARSGGEAAAEASGRWTPDGGEAQGRLSLATSTLLAPYVPILGSKVRFEVEGGAAGRDLYRIRLVGAGQKVAFAARGEVDIARRATGPHGLSLALSLADPSKLIKTGQSGPLTLSGGLGGDQQRWVMSGQADLQHPAIGVAFRRISGPFRVEGSGRRVAVDANLAGEGAAGGGLYGALLGARPTAAGRIELIDDGRAILRRVTVIGAGVRIDGRGEQDLFSGLSFSGRMSAANIGRFVRGARGGLLADLNARQAGRKPWTFTLKAKANGLATGAAQVDRLLGAAPALSATGAFDGKVFSLASASLSGKAAGATAAGKVGPDGRLRLALTWRANGPFEAGPLEIDGAVKGKGDIGGSLAAPSADLLADFTHLDLPSLPLRDAHVVLRLANANGALQGRLGLTAESAQGPARAAGAFRLSKAALDVSDLDAAAGGVALKGGFALAGGAPSRADLTFVAGPGAFLEHGHSSGRVRIIDAAGGPRADLSVQGSDVVLPSGPELKTVKITASGPIRRLPYRAEASGIFQATPWRFAGSGVFAEAASSGGQSALTFEGVGRIRAIDLRTAGPAHVAVGGGRYDLAAAVLAGGGRADVSATLAGDTLQARANLASVSLATFDPDLAGTMSGQLTLAGRGAALSGSLDARLAKAALRGGRVKEAFDGEVSATLSPRFLAVNADLTALSSSTARIEASLPVEATAAPFRLSFDPRRPMSGRFAIDGEVGPLWDVFMGDEQTLSGRLVANGTLGGTPADPRAVGVLNLNNGRFADSSTGLKLRDVGLQATLGDRVIDVTHLEGRDAERGRLSGSGRVGLDRDGVSSLALTLNGFRLIDNDYGQASASGTVTVSRAANGKVRLAGALTLDRAQIAPKTPTPSGVVPMEVVEIHKPVDPDAVPNLRPARGSPVDLDVTLSAPGGVFVKGRGLNVELSLNAKVVGSTAAPVLTGEARVVHGDYDFAGQRFTFAENGVVHLSSDPAAIRLDLTATRDNPALTAVIRITGTAEKPIVTLTSTPALPQDEVLAQVLFGSSVSSLNGFQAAQLASALSGLASGGGFDVIGGLRNLAHLDRLAINSSAKYGNSVAGGKYLSDKVYLELSGGAREGPGAQLEWRIRRHLAIVSRVTSQGEQSLSIRWRKDY